MIEANLTAKNREYLRIVRSMDNVARRGLIPALFVLVLIAHFCGIPYPFLPSIILLLAFIAVGAIVTRMIEQGWGPARDLYFGLLCFNCLIAGLAIYYTGGIESFMPQALTIVVVLAGLTFLFWQTAAIVAICCLTYAAELWLEASMIVPHLTIFPGFIDPAAYAGSVYFRVIPLANMLILASTAALAYMAARVLETREEKLGMLNRRLEINAQLLVKRDEEKTALNEQLKKKMSELEELKGKLEKMLEARTQDLKVKVDEMSRIETELKNNVAGLEAINSSAVAQELLLIDLETEANSLLAELGRKPKY